MKINNPTMFSYMKESLNEAIREGKPKRFPQEQIQEIE